jgi:Ca2+-transporting ATPase
MQVRALEAVDRAEALVAMVVANDADLGTGAGDPLERGLLEFARAEGCEPERVRERRPRAGGRPFDAAWKFMRVTVEGEGARASYLKGAPEVMLARSTLAPEERARWLRRAEEQGSEGLRVLALASAAGEGESELRFLGLVALWDPPRPEVPDAVRAAQKAGVRILMVTGDHPATALAVARSLGIADAHDGACTGTELDGLAAPALRALVARTAVFARVSPEHKLAIVEALRDAGEIVAVTGDGVNDAPALKRSDVGVAMGQRGSDVAREVADLVLLDDNFASIVAAIEEGRGIYANIQKFIRFLFSTNASELLVVLAGTLGAWALDLREASGSLLLPLTAVQILWVNFITDGPPALALGVDRNLGVMDRPPRPPRSPLLDGPSARFVVVTGSLKALLAGVLLVGLPWLGTSLEATRTCVFLYVTLGQLVFAYPARRLEGESRRNLALDLAVLVGGGVQLLTVFVPGLRDLLGLVPLALRELALVLAAVGATWLAAELVGRVLRSNARAKRAAAGPAA